MTYIYFDAAGATKIISSIMFILWSSSERKQHFCFFFFEEINRMCLQYILNDGDLSDEAAVFVFLVLSFLIVNSPKNGTHLTFGNHRNKTKPHHFTFFSYHQAMNEVFFSNWKCEYSVLRNQASRSEFSSSLTECEHCLKNLTK